ECWVKEDRLRYVAAMLGTLGDMMAATGCPLLTYFLDLAAAEARDEYREAMNQLDRSSVLETGAHLH
ncbi:MAG: hypothetical protein ABSC22_08200, partial [Roseiarcus sp.]